MAQTNCNDVCDYWQTKVDNKIKIKVPDSEKPVSSEFVIPVTSNDLDADSGLPFSDLSEAEIFSAIECLLRLKGNKYDSKIGGATRPDVSQRFGATTVEVAALYYISYIFFQKWDHADAPFITDSMGDLNSVESVRLAFESYELWFEKVKQIGLEESRKEKLDPLNGSGLSWY